MERYESAEHFILCNSRVCPECDELRVNYELNESGVCIYCEEDEDEQTSGMLQMQSLA
jgi:hypothetical protein